MRVPSGLNAAEQTASSWPRRASELAWPVAASHTRAVLSPDAVTIRVPSGLNAADLTSSSCPRRASSSLAAGRVPHPRGLVLRRGDDPRPVRAERAPSRPRPRARAGPAGSWPVAASHTRAVLSQERGDDPRPVRAERGRADRVLVPAQGQRAPAGGRVPHPRGLVPGRGDDPRPVRAERGRGDPALMPAQGQRAPGPWPRPTPARSCPQERGDDPRPVRAERGRVDRVLMPAQGQRARLPVAASHTRAVLSSDAVTIRAPSGLNAAA